MIYIVYPEGAGGVRKLPALMRGLSQRIASASAADLKESGRRPASQLREVPCAPLLQLRRRTQ